MICDFAFGYEDRAPKAPLKIWDLKSQEEGRSCAYFEQDFDKHLDVLGQSEIGKYLLEDSRKHTVRFQRVVGLPENTEARYVRIYNQKTPGTVEYGKRIHATLLGHELRHVWQHLSPAFAEIRPQSPEEQILHDRFMEADARAVEFAITAECAYALGRWNLYAQNLVACLDPYQKEILLFSDKELTHISSQPAAMKQAMRMAFDKWIGMSPLQPKYDEQTEKTISLSETGFWSRTFSRIANRGKESYPPSYSYRGISPDFLPRLTQALGGMGPYREGNYLLDTNGLPFDDPFYTRTCNYRLESRAARITPR